MVKKLVTPTEFSARSSIQLTKIWWLVVGGTAQSKYMTLGTEE
jgi:hypothetical protein